MYDLGYMSITSVDTSTIVVSQMQYRYKDREGMDFMVGDAMKVSRNARGARRGDRGAGGIRTTFLLTASPPHPLPQLDMFPDCSFDFVLDKGCLDCIYCSYNSIDNAKMAYSESWRLLKPGTGKYISISYGTPDTRSAHMKTNKWDVEVTPVAYSHGISMFIATRFPESTKKGRLKAAMKYGALMGRNTSKDKWKPKQESKKHSTMTKHEDKVAQLSLQGIKMLTTEEEKDLELDPSKGFHIEDVEGELKNGFDDNTEQERKIKEEHLDETVGIIGETIKEGDIDDRGPTSLARVMSKAVKDKAGPESKIVGMLGGKKGGGKRQSAIWNLAKKTLGDMKDVVKEGDVEDQLIKEDEWRELQD